MNTVRLFHRAALAILAVFVLVQPAAAQDETEADTIFVEEGRTVVIVGDEGRQIIIRSADDEGHRFFFDSDDYSRIFDWDGNVRLRGHRPRVMEFRGNLLDDNEHVGVLSDYLDGLGSVWVDRFGDDSQVRLAESMKGRSEVMRMEMESRRLAQQARRAEGEERTRLEAELDEKLQEIFDRKQALREEQIDKLREEMNEALDKHNEREQNRREIIERRLNQLLGKSSRYDW